MELSRGELSNTVDCLTCERDGVTTAYRKIRTRVTKAKQDVDRNACIFLVRIFTEETIQYGNKDDRLILDDSFRIARNSWT